MNHDPIPGTHEPGFEEQPFLEFGNKRVRDAFLRAGAKGVKFFHMGECTIIRSREPSGLNGEMLWHLTISTPNRHPTWDEIKTTRYRLLPPELTFGMLLPPAENYINVPEQDHTFHLYEIRDPREPWTAG